MNEKLESLARWSVGLEIAGTAVSSVDRARDVHIADSAAAVELDFVRAAESIVDIGSGLGFPGLVLAVLLPQTKVTLVDSVRKKMQAAERISRELELDNVECVWGRVEELGALGSPQREAFDLVTARALAPLAVLLEYAAPLLALDGRLLAWKGDPDEEELTAAGRAASELEFVPDPLLPVVPFAGSARRHFWSARKLKPTSQRYPRRPGVAVKRPLGAKPAQNPPRT